MKRSVTILIFLIAFLASGCSTIPLEHLTIQEFQGDANLEYPASAGHIDVRGYIKGIGNGIDLQRISLDYSVRPHEDGLQWTIQAKAQLAGVKDGKPIDIGPSGNIFQLLALQDSHPEFIINIRTDVLGNFISLDKIEDATTGKSWKDTYWSDQYRQIFSMIFVPFSTSRAPVGSTVSHGKIMIPVNFGQHFPDSNIVLLGEDTVRLRTGEKSIARHDCLVLEYKMESNPYKNKKRQKVTHNVEAFLYVDKETKVICKAYSEFKLRNGYMFIEAKYSPPHSKTTK